MSKGEDQGRNSGSAVRRGMDDLVVDTTAISWVDGEGGNLYYRGISIGELAAHASFEETAYLLLCGTLPTASQLEAFTWKLRALAFTPEKVLRILQELPRTTQPLAALQTALAALSCVDPGERYSKEESLLEKAMRIVAQTPVLLGAAYRHHRGVPIVAPRNDLNHAENFMYMLTGRIPSKRQARVMELALILQMDHGFNSSTFTARAVASTLTNMYAATSAAVGALSGPLHGGASEAVVDMLEEAESSGDVEAYTIGLLASGGKIMGMGHRVYRNIDPRARIFENMLHDISTEEEEEADDDLKALKRIESVATKYFADRGKPIFVNVDFWSGAVYRKLGIQKILYPAIFAAARIAGWTAHILELRQDNRLYRPKSKYIGDLDVPYVPLEERT
ncbi:MAG: citrate/2-methylcitrate synthase [Silvanigrellales bacterium]|nr:citrate/2-methylcitrate synthase [Silvanigrellales bacterium]